jgi:hypothetical protein
MENNPYSLFTEMKDDGTGFVRAVRKTKAGDDLPFILGEFFYQLRAALDSLLYRAAIIQTKRDPPPDENRLEFPITIADKYFKKTAYHGIPFPDELRNWIESIQPNNADKTIGTEWHGINRILRLLHDCARKDRHRRLHVVGAPPHSLTGQVHVPMPAKLVSFVGVPCNLLDDESIFLQFAVEGYVPGMQIYIDGDFTVDVVINEIPGIRGQQVNGILVSCEEAVMSVIRKFEEFYI